MEAHHTVRATRIVDSLTLHGTTDFASMAAKIVNPSTRYLVLDLDRTVHLEHNVGELLGWELSAYLGYGKSYIEKSLTRSDRGRFFLDFSQPWGMLRYLAKGFQHWVPPGLFYLVTGKLADRFPRLRRRVYRRFGPDAVDTVQSVPRNALLHQMSAVPLSVVRDLTRSLWQRLEPDQVITRRDLETLRAIAPNLQIIICSASPLPVVDTARMLLGADAAIATRVEEHEGYLSTPFEPRLFGGMAPRRISPPSRTHDNAAKRKIEALRKHYPDIFSAGVESVGITDTSYGEDHSWAGHFTKVVDINSPHPFAPIVPASAPLSEIHSAQVLTQEEIRRRKVFYGYEDPRRRQHSNLMASFGRGELAAKLQTFAERMETLAQTYEARRREREQMHDELAQRIAESLLRIETAVTEYNAALGRSREVAFAKLGQYLREARKMRNRMLDLERPLGELAEKQKSLLAAARSIFG